MAFSDHVSGTAGQDVSFLFYVTIGGLDRIFVAGRWPVIQWIVPAPWTSWSSTLIFSRWGAGGSDRDILSRQYDYERGVAISSSIDLEFGVDVEDPGSEWINRYLTPSGVLTTYLRPQDVQGIPTVVRPSDTNIPLLASIGAIQGSVVHCGTEAIRVGAIGSGTNLLNCTRGYLGTIPQWYGTRGNAAASGFGSLVEFSNFPRVWRNRPVSVWCAPGYRNINGLFVPLSSAPFGTEDQELFRGVVDELEWSADEPVAVLRCRGLEDWLDRPVVSRPRRYSIGPDSAEVGWVYVEDGGPCLVEYDLGANPIPEEDVARHGIVNIVPTMQTLFGSAGLVTTIKLCQAVVAALNSATLTGPLDGAVFPDGVVWAWSIFSDPRETVDRVRFHAALLTAGATTIGFLTDDVVLRFKSARFPDLSVLPALGATDDIEIPSGTAGEATDIEGIPEEASALEQFYATGTAQETVPYYYLGPVGQTRIYYRAHNDYLNALTQDPPVRQGTASRDFNVDQVFVRWGEHEVLEVQFRETSPTNPTFVDTGSPEASGRQLYAVIHRRGLAGGRPEAVSIPRTEADDTDHALEVGLLFEEHYLLDALRWLLISNGDRNTGAPWSDGSIWNSLPEGMGANIPDSYFDLDSFEAMHQELATPKASGWWIPGDETVRETVAAICMANGLTLLPRLVGGRLKLSLAVAAGLPLDSRSISAPVKASVNNSWWMPTNPPTVDKDERSIVNRISVAYDYDVPEETFLSKDNNFLDINSIAQYGAKGPIDLKLPWVRGYANMQAQMRVAAGWIFLFRGHPHVMVTVPYAPHWGWIIEPGDTVLLTCPWLPHWRGDVGGIGLVDVPMTVVENHINAGLANGIARGRLVLRWAPALDPLVWAPSFRLLRHVSGTTYTVRRDDTEGGFSSVERGNTDLEFFVPWVGDSVFLVLPYDGAVNELATISAINVAARTITFAGAVTLSPLDDVVGELGSSSAYVSPVVYDPAVAFFCDSVTFTFTGAGAVGTRSGARWF